jgi:hypothetical protein
MGQVLVQRLVARDREVRAEVPDVDVRQVAGQPPRFIDQRQPLEQPLVVEAEVVGVFEQGVGQEHEVEARAGVRARVGEHLGVEPCDQRRPARHAVGPVAAQAPGPAELLQVPVAVHALRAIGVVGPGIEAVEVDRGRGAQRGDAVGQGVPGQQVGPGGFPRPAVEVHRERAVFVRHPANDGEGVEVDAPHHAAHGAALEGKPGQQRLLVDHRSRDRELDRAPAQRACDHRGPRVFQVRGAEHHGVEVLRTRQRGILVALVAAVLRRIERGGPVVLQRIDREIERAHARGERECGP